MNIWKRYIRKKVEKYLDDIKVDDISNKEKCKYMVEVSGVRIDDLIEPPEEIPFSKTQYFKKEKEAKDFGKIEYKDGNKIEVWKLIVRYV